MNNRHRQVEKWKAYYKRQREKRMDEAIQRANDALAGVADAFVSLCVALQSRMVKGFEPGVMHEIDRRRF